MIDLRSDTVTRPTEGMLDAMLSAKVGDDVYGEDEAINELQEKAAGMFGMGAALFCPSGTMTNQIGMRVHLQPGDEVICHELAHVYLFEGGGIAANSGSSVSLIRGTDGMFTAKQVVKHVNPRNDSHSAWSRLVALENTTNMGGGRCWNIAEIKRIREVCVKNDLRLHLDGARLFNALIATGESPQTFGKLFDTISICLSKGLGAPVGSLLLGSKDHIGKAHRVRKSMGGAMRQAGYLAAAGTYALDNHVERLAEDHDKAKRAGETLDASSAIEEVLPVETNIVIFKLNDRHTSKQFVNHLRAQGVLVSALDDKRIRLVFHLDVSNDGFARALDAIESFSG